jgi:dipeptidyl aminopeptidase/acylaminoacyl peptidase
MKLTITMVLLATSLAKAEPMYQKTEPQISKLINAQDFSRLEINYGGTAGLKLFALYTPPIDYISRPKLKLAGIQLNPKNYSTVTTAVVSKLFYFDIATKKEKEIKFSKGAYIRGRSWSFDDNHFAVSIETPDCHEAWIVDSATLKKTKIPVCLNTVGGIGMFWVDNETLGVSHRTAEQKKGYEAQVKVPAGPIVQDATGQVSQNRTYQNLLKSPDDERAFTDVTETQISFYNLKKKTIKKIGKPGIYRGFSISPDQKFILVSRIEKPYSYVVPIDLFKLQFEVWDINGKLQYKLHSSGPHENVPIQGVIKGPRSMRWMADEPHTLQYVQALDDGDWKNKVEFRDELFKMELLSGGKTKSSSLYKIKNRFAGLSTFDRKMGVLVWDYERDTEWIRAIHLKFKDNKSSFEKVLFSLNENDEYADLGTPIETENKYNRSVIAVDKDDKSIYLNSRGASPDGYRPALNKFNIESLENKEIYRTEKGSTNSFQSFIGHKKFDKFITIFETDVISPRFMLNEIVDGKLKSEILYADPNPFEVFSKVKKEVLRYKRADGVDLSGTLYYPLGYEAGKKYPLIVDAYPLEYTDASTAGQVRNSAYTFETPYRASTMYLALRGYAVLMEAQIPIIGHPETKNDTFLKQLQDGAAAAVKAVADKGVADSSRAGVIGHSYGAFMVANLLTHTDLFATGVARSGAYNRTLTPYGFQGERRTYWNAKDTYLKVSPFHEVDKLKKPILLIHGQIDENSGTFPLQSERYFEALKGQGVKARLVLLPQEGHSYAAVESIEHVLYETFTWFDRYLK